MRGGLLLFLLALGGSAAGWFLAVAPVLDEAGSSCGRLEELGPGWAGEKAAAWPGPTPEETAALEEAAAALAPAPVPPPPPEGIEVDPRGLARGTLPWDAVQDLFAWAAAQPRPILSVEVDALDGDPGRAACRVVFEEAGR